MVTTARKAPRVVVIGGGFGGLSCARALAPLDVEITLVDRRNHHLFQPLLYQVAMSGLSPAEIAAPIRSILARQQNLRVLLAEVTGIDREARTVALTDGALDYDFLVVAAGARTTYFGHDEWEAVAPGLKSIEDALEIRRRVLLAFEQAEREHDEARQRELLTFVVVGGGPTGVELAGALAELSRTVLAEDFRRIDPRTTRVVLIEGGERVLSSFPVALSRRAVEQLADLGVEVRAGTLVDAIDARGVDVRRGDARERIDAATVVWGAGVSASSLGAALGAELDRAGRVKVTRECALEGDARVFVVGDMAAFEQDGKALPGVSPVAMQQGRFVAECIARDLEEQPRRAFRYVDKGSMATIGRSRAIALAGSLQLSGLLAWLAWLVVHIWYLIGFRSRIVVIFTWAWSYFAYRRGARLITESGWPGERAPERGDPLPRP